MTTDNVRSGSPDALLIGLRPLRSDENSSDCLSAEQWS